MEYVPDNYDAFIVYESENERMDRLHKRMQLEIDNKEQEERNE